MATIVMNCVDCNTEYYYTDRDQEFFAEKGWTPPKRCRPCRAERKANKSAQDTSPTSFRNETSGGASYIPDPMTTGWTNGSEMSDDRSSGRRGGGRRRSRGGGY